MTAYGIIHALLSSKEQFNDRSPVETDRFFRGTNPLSYVCSAGGVCPRFSFSIGPSVMFTVHHISKSYSTHTILKDIYFSVNAGDRVGLIGPNGCGKTTLLRILAGEETPDQGAITFSRPDLRIGYLPQGFQPGPGESAGDVLKKVLGSVEEAEAELARLAAAISKDPQDENLQEDYDAALQRLQSLSSSRNPAPVLNALGLGDIGLDTPASILSGGQKTRLGLALVLLGEPQALLLDEPSNHLDIEMLEWLEDWLADFPGAALIVSHDRTFLDRTVNRILDIDPEKHSLREYSGNYSAYLEQYLAEREQQMGAYKDQVYEIRRMKQDIARTKQQSLRVELTTTSRQPGVRRYAKKVARKAKSREKKLDRFLESSDRVEKPKESWQMKLEFNAPDHKSGHVLTLEKLAVGYPGHGPLLQNLNLHVRGGQRIVMTGPNGAGKTSLLRTIAGQVEPHSGQVRVATGLRMGYMTQEQEFVDPELNALEMVQSLAPLNETDARSFLHYFLFDGDDPLRPASNLSYGERARLVLALLAAQGSNFLLLDEPINHLDIPSRARFERALSGFDGAVLAVVHDRYFIERFADEVWLVKDGQATRQAGAS